MDAQEREKHIQEIKDRILARLAKEDFENKDVHAIAKDVKILHRLEDAR